MSRPALVAVKQPRRRIRSLIQGYLWDWGQWVEAANCSGLSYPPYSVEGRMQVNGGYAPSIRTSRIPRYFPDHRILKLHKQIVKLPDEDKKLLMYRYISCCAFDDVAHYVEKNIHYVRYNLERIENTLHLPR